MQFPHFLKQDLVKKNNTNRRLVFLDVLKGLAIIAVICDHSKVWSQLCPLKFLPFPITFFSVSLFVLCAGYTSVLSLERNTESPLLWIRRKVVHILVSYFVATAIYLFFADPAHVIHINKFLTVIIRFNASPPFYFLAFFLQLLCVAPFFYNLLSAKGGKFHFVLKMVFYLLSLLLSYACLKHTYINDMLLAGHFLLGGTFFAAYVTGQLICIYRDIVFRKVINLILLIASASLFYLSHARCFNRIQFISNMNPPGARHILYALTVFFAISFLFLLFPKILSFALAPVSFLGKYSLEIFLYHFLVMKFCGNYFRVGSNGGIVITDANPTWNLFICRAIVFPRVYSSHSIYIYIYRSCGISLLFICPGIVHHVYALFNKIAEKLYERIELKCSF